MKWRGRGQWWRRKKGRRGEGSGGWGGGESVEG